jgi:hypothetical protein
VDPKRRRIVVDADALAYDDDFLSYDDTQSGHLHIQVDVDPWQRIASGSDSVCADEEATDKLVAEARLLDDLETVRVTLKAQIQEGTSCGAKGCGEERAVFDVPAGGSAYDDELQVNCFWWPIPGFEEKDTYARFTDITMYNTQAPAP